VEYRKGTKVDYTRPPLNKNQHLLVLAHSYKAFVKDQVELISDNFTKVTVIARHNPISELSHIFPSSYLSSHTKTALIDLAGKPDNISVLTSPVLYAPIDSEYRRLGDRHFKSVQKLIKHDNIQFDSILCHFVWSAGYVGVRLKEIYKVPLIVVAHGFDIYDLPFRDNDWRKRIEYVLNAADKIITVSNSNLACINRLSVKTPVSMIPNGFRDDLFYPRNQAECRKALGLPPDVKILLTVGNLDIVKGHLFLIEAMREIIKHRQDVFCIVIGDGKERQKLERLIVNMN
jgi:glycosyltransferase involved in cell wall biosynthesis